MPALEPLQLAQLPVKDFGKCLDKKGAATLQQWMETASRAQLLQLSQGLLQQVERVHQLISRVLDETGGPLDPEQPEQAEALLAVKTSAGLALELLHKTHQQMLPGLAEAAELLHDLLLALDPHYGVMEAVAKLCCCWWQYGAAGKEALVSQTLPYVLLRALQEQKAGQVKVVYALRGAFELLDYEDASITDLKRMLLQAAICPGFLKRPDGRKFLGGLLTLHATLVPEVASIIRNQVPGGRASVLEAYGEIILRGWRAATGPCLMEIEQHLIQDLVTAAVHGRTQGLVSNLRALLGVLLEAKKAGGGPGAVDGLLVRVCEPVLFRALAASNPAVRRNALQLLLDAFPLLDPDASVEEQDALLVRQFTALGDALVDACPAVRALAATGVAGQLNLYWEIIPSATTAGFVSKLVEQLAFDGSSPLVRAAVLQGLQLLVDNTHAQPVLKKALPLLAPLLVDTSPRVREAMADLLLAMATCRGLHWWEVVEQETVLEVMVEAGLGGPGGLELAERLHALLLPSYYPGPEEGPARVAGLLKTQPGAGQMFCRLLAAPLLAAADPAKAAGLPHVQVAAEGIVSLMHHLVGHLLSHPPIGEITSPPNKQRGNKAAAAAGGRASGAAGKRRQAAQPDEAGAAAAGAAGEVAVVPEEETPETWSALLGGVVELGAGLAALVEAELCDDGEVRRLLPAGALQQLLAVAPDARAAALAWRLVESLQGLSPTQSLCYDLLGKLAAGELQPHLDLGAGLLGSDGASAGAGQQEKAHEQELAGMLACVAASPCAPRLVALLRQALGLAWGPDWSKVTPVTEEEEDPAEYAHAEHLACKVCRKGLPAKTLLLCDGCEDAYHTGCCSPELPGVPEGDWFCTSCSSRIQGSVLSREGALATLLLLLGTAAGQQLLQASGLLVEAGPQLVAAAAAAVAEADADLQRLASAAAAGSSKAKKGSAQAAGAVMKTLAAAVSACGLASQVLLHAAAAQLATAAGAAGQQGGSGDPEAVQGVLSSCSGALQVLISCTPLWQRLAATALPLVADTQVQVAQAAGEWLASTWDAWQLLGLLLRQQAAVDACRGLLDGLGVVLELLETVQQDAADAAEISGRGAAALQPATRLLGALLPITLAHGSGSSVEGHDAAAAAGSDASAVITRWLGLVCGPLGQGYRSAPSNSSSSARGGRHVAQELVAPLAAWLEQQQQQQQQRGLGVNQGQPAEPSTVLATAGSVEALRPLIRAAAGAVREAGGSSGAPQITAVLGSKRGRSSHAAAGGGAGRADADGCGTEAAAGALVAVLVEAATVAKAAPALLEALLQQVLLSNQGSPNTDWAMALGCLHLAQQLSAFEYASTSWLRVQQGLREVAAAASADKGDTALVLADELQVVLAGM